MANKVPEYDGPFILSGMLDPVKRICAYITYIQGIEGDLIHTPVKYILNTRDDTSSAVALTWVHSMQGTYADDLCL